MSLPVLTAQRHAGALPGIKLSHLLFNNTVSSSDYMASSDGTIKLTEKNVEGCGNCPIESEFRPSLGEAKGNHGKPHSK
jgi:hypothetical protein